MEIALTQPRRRTDRIAIASLICGFLFFPLGPFGSIPAIIFGHVAWWRISKDPARVGRGFAIIGLVLGYIGLAITVYTIYFWRDYYASLLR